MRNLAPYVKITNAQTLGSAILLDTCEVTHDKVIHC